MPLNIQRLLPDHLLSNHLVGRTLCARSKDESKPVSEVLEVRKQSTLCSRTVCCVANTAKQLTSRQTVGSLQEGVIHNVS